jgi:hydroxypyruvate isomerase
VDEFRRGITDQALPYAQALGCQRLHVMAGLVPAGADRAALRATYVANLAWAAHRRRRWACRSDRAHQHTRHPRLLPQPPGRGTRHRAEVGAANLKVQFDLYHCQIVEGDLAMKIRQYLPTGRVGHIQIAGVPERHEPDLGELHHPYLFSLLDEVGYSGHVGAEYRPRGATSAGLGWFGTLSAILTSPHLARPP